MRQVREGTARRNDPVALDRREGADSQSRPPKTLTSTTSWLPQASIFIGTAAAAVELAKAGIAGIVPRPPGGQSADCTCDAQTMTQVD